MVYFYIGVIIFSFIGYYRLCREKIKLEPELCPGFITSVLGVCLVLFGILRILRIGADLLLYGGVFVFFYYYIFNDLIKMNREKRTSKKNSPGLLVFIIGVIFLVIRLYNEKFYYHDNLSHWGIIVKNLCHDSAFPNDSDIMIQFKSYPLGCSVVIWYFLRLFGYSEGKALAVKSIIVLSFALCFFAIKTGPNKKKIIICNILKFVGCISLVSCFSYYRNGLYELLVDQLLPAIAVYAYLVIDYYEDNLERAVWIIAPIFAYEISVKTSGLFFCIALIPVVLYKIQQRQKNKKQILILVIPSIVSIFFMRFLWWLHTTLTFTNVNKSMHAISLTNYASIFGEKTKEDIVKITHLFIDAFLHHSAQVLSILLLFLAFYCIIVYKKMYSIKLNIKALIIYIIITHIVYQIGLYMVYIFSMPLIEAQYLQCYDRYSFSFYLFEFGIILIAMIKAVIQIDFSSVHNVYRELLIYITVIVCVIMQTDSFTALFDHSPDTIPSTYYEAKNLIERIKTENNIEENPSTSYLVYLSDVGYDENFRGFTATYEFYSNHITTIGQEELESVDYANLKEFDYFVVVYEDEYVKQYLSNMGISYKEVIELG